MKRALAAFGILILFWFAAPNAIAQSLPVVDLGISAELLPRGQLLPGTTARLVLRFRNEGPGTAGRAGAVSSPYFFGIGQQFALVPAQPNICSMAFTDFTGPPGTPVTLIASIFAGPLAPGEQRECTFDVPISPNATGQTSLSFRVDDAAQAIDDPNAMNNRAILGLMFDPPLQVPASQGATLVLLGLAMALASAGWFRRTLPANVDQAPSFHSRNRR